GTPVLGDHDLPPLLYVVEKSSQVLTCFAYAGSSHDRHYVTRSTIQFPTRSRAIGVPYSSLPCTDAQPCAEPLQGSRVLSRLKGVIHVLPQTEVPDRCGGRWVRHRRDCRSSLRSP